MCACVRLCYWDQPSADYPPEEVLRFVLTGLKFNDTPKPNTGLRRWFAFSNDQCRCSIAVWDSWKQDRDNEVSVVCVSLVYILYIYIYLYIYYIYI